MVKEVKIKDRILFRCEACGFYYETQEMAQKCQDFCEKFSSCSMEFTKHAISVVIDEEIGE